MYSAISHYRLATTRTLTALEVKARLLRHNACIAGRGHTPQDCAARAQLLGIHADHGWTWPVPSEQSLAEQQPTE